MIRTKPIDPENPDRSWRAVQIPFTALGELDDNIQTFLNYMDGALYLFIYNGFFWLTDEAMELSEDKAYKMSESLMDVYRWLLDQSIEWITEE